MNTLKNAFAAALAIGAVTIGATSFAFAGDPCDDACKPDIPSPKPEPAPPAPPPPPPLPAPAAPAPKAPAKPEPAPEKERPPSTDREPHQSTGTIHVPTVPPPDDYCPDFDGDGTDDCSDK